MPEEIDNIKDKIKDIKAVMLLQERDIIFSEFDEQKAKYISNAIYCLVTDIKETHDFEAMMVAAEKGKFFIFSHKEFFLGISSGVKTNFAFLKFLVRMAFSRGKKGDKGENEISEDLPYFLKIACSDYFKKYPE